MSANEQNFYPLNEYNSRNKFNVDWLVAAYFVNGSALYFLFSPILFWFSLFSYWFLPFLYWFSPFLKWFSLFLNWFSLFFNWFSLFLYWFSLFCRFLPDSSSRQSVWPFFYTAHIQFPRFISHFFRLTHITISQFFSYSLR